MKKLLAILLVFVLTLSFVACGNDDSSSSAPEVSKEESKAPVSEETSKEESKEESKEVSVEVSEEPSEPSSEEPVVKEIVNYLKTASAVSVDGSVTGESVVIFTNADAAKTGNCRWSINVVLEKVSEGVYEVISSAPGDGTDWAGTLEENQILLAVHSDGSEGAQNLAGKAAAMALVAGDQLTIVGIEEKDIQTLKTHEDKDKTAYVKELPKNLINYVVFADNPIGGSFRITSSESIPLTGINVEPTYGASIIYYGYNWDTTLGKKYDWSNFAIIVVDYDHSVYGFKKTQIIMADDSADKGAVTIPTNGFVLAVSKDNEAIYKKIANIKDSNKFFVSGIAVYEGDTWNVPACDDDKPVIDGKIGDGEWDDDCLVSTVDENNELWDYSQFEVNNYDTTGKIYMKYDSEFLYFMVVVETPSHYCPHTLSNCKSMWDKTCIQVNIMNQSPYSDYIKQHYDHENENSAISEGNVRQYGFSVNGNGETLYCLWMGNGGFTGEACVIRDEEEKTTYYEVAIPWTDVNVTDVEPGKEISVSFSLNVTTEEQKNAGKWFNVRYIDGGGIIGRNDWSKMPLVVLK